MPDNQKKTPAGYVTIEIISSFGIPLGNKTLYMEVGETKFSGYIKCEAHKPIFLEGDIDVAE